MHNNYVAIMAGGIGSRFWPDSREHLPKQFLDLLGVGMTLLQSTYERFKDICPKENIYIVTGKKYIDIVKKQLPEINDNQIIAEPFRKNTAPAAAYATYKIQALNPKANIIFAPADHLILNQKNFEITAFEALDFVAHHKALLTIGIKPTRPDINYGYVQYEEDNESEDNVYKVKTFTDKPNIEIARSFIKSGDFVWNSGIFAWNVDTFIAAFKKYVPELSEVFEQGKAYYHTPKEAATMERLYMQCTNVSMDYGIMEKADNVFIIPSILGWSDLGSWESTYENSERDYLGNVVKGDKVMIVDATECLIKAPKGKLMVIQGLHKHIVVDTADALIICERSKEQEIKDYVADVKRNFGEQYL